MRSFKFSAVLAAIVFLTGCASALDGPTQNIVIETPGAQESECMLTNGIKYRVKGGDITRIQRSHRDLVIDCYASGNRHQQRVIPSALNEWGLANVTNAVVPGTTYDHFSGGLYAYPPKITVDFVGTPTRGFETPSYQNKDAPNPYLQSIEGYGPSSIQVPSDSEYTRRGVQKRNSYESVNPFSTGSAAGMARSGTATTTTTTTTTVKTTPVIPSGGTADQLTRSANPSVFNP